ncbi:protein PLASTID MOVEMENT IMPAIRED 1-RELATED 1 [Oryza brachyantha]|uniref:protein PLASTID MOVEMENT IMPAIRED 1-RELATED 1 n=1 Tax=Oryza brachyantha TaxID=4533 RepID=UPI001ADC6017|nr:protein PLASTID MOVEMENT IMPAIRED 1-RELATED 1 [Oryza brachyantha]
MSSRFLVPPPGAADRAGGDAGDAALARDIVTLHKALSLDPNSSSSSSRRRRSLPLPLTAPSVADQARQKPRLKPSSSARRLLPSASSSSGAAASTSSSSSFWKKSLTAISHLGRRRLDCAFTLHVHSVDGLPAALDGSPISVHFRRMSLSASTRPVAAALGAASFEEVLTQRSPVYFSRSAKAAVKYEPRAFIVVASTSALELGKHEVDLTRLLPLSFDDLEEGGGSGFGKWSTSFRLSGPARGARLNVTFSCALVGAGAEQHKGGEVAGLRRGSMARQVSVQTPTPVPARSRDVRVLHEVLPSGRTVKALPFFGDAGLDSRKEEVSTVESEENESPQSKHCTSVEVKKADVAHPEGDCDGAEFSVVEQGVEIALEDPEQLKSVGTDNVADGKEDFRDGVGEKGEPKAMSVGVARPEEGSVGVKPEEGASDVAFDSEDAGEVSMVKAVSLSTAELDGDDQLDADLDDLGCLINDLSIVEPEQFDSPTVEDKHSRRLSYVGVTDSSNSASRMIRSRSMDASSDFVANEFLDMLGIEHSPFGATSGSDSESPRERLWKQFEKETLASGNGILGLDFEDEAEEPSNEDDMEETIETSCEAHDFDLSTIIREAELELQNAVQPIETRFRAKSLEDEETEALMRQFGLNEKSFQSSPPGSRSGFGSPIDLPPESPLELPPLADGLGPFVQTKDGGFLRSMNPVLFKNAKNNCSLVMQASSPIVLPAEMGSGIMEILHGLASVGIEKLSMQANKLMPLEDVNGKMMQQIAWEASPALESAERYDLLDDHSMDALAGGIGNTTFGKNKKGKCTDLSSSLGRESTSEYVSLEDLAPLAMEKIEALSIEGLRIQSGMSEEDAPSNISAQSIGEFSSLQGKCSGNTLSLGLEGTAGLQLLDVKQSGGDVDGLMGLSITLDEWMRLDSGVVDEDDQFTDRTSKILAAHHAKSMELVAENWNTDKKNRRSGRRWGLLGNNFTVALMVQLRDPLRNYEPVGTPMLALIQVERVFVPPKPKIYSTVTDRGNSEHDDEEPKGEQVLEKALVKEEKIEEEHDSIPQFKVTEVHVAGFKSEPEKTKPWGSQTQQQSGSRWLLAAGMSKGNKHPLMKSKAITKPSKEAAGQSGDTLWSISSRVHGAGTRWGELAGPKRNPNILLQKEKRFR